MALFAVIRLLLLIIFYTESYNYMRLDPTRFLCHVLRRRKSVSLHMYDRVMFRFVDRRYERTSTVKQITGYEITRSDWLDVHVMQTTHSDWPRNNSCGGSSRVWGRHQTVSFPPSLN